MLTWEDDLEVHALRKRGWSISAIARHTGHDRKTVCKYLAGDAEPGVHARPSPDPFDPFVDYVTARLVEDPHLWARTLFDELEGLGFGLSYQSLTRAIAEIDHPLLRSACTSTSFSHVSMSRRVPFEQLVRGQRPPASKGTRTARRSRTGGEIQ